MAPLPSPGSAMTVLVTGGAGFIGSHTCADLLDHGHDVVIVDDHSNSSPGALRALREVTRRELAAYRADLRDDRALGEVFARHPIDAVIHFAAKKVVPESVRIPLEYYSVNVGGTVSLLRVMREHAVRRLVFSSSCSVYGDQFGHPITEDEPPGPVNPYARSKLVCEQVLADACASDGGLSVIALRYFNPVGAHPSGGLGEEPRGAPRALMPCITQVAAGLAAELLVFGGDYPTPDGTAIRDYVHVMDVAGAHRVALAHIDEQPGLRVRNIGTGAGTSVLQMVAAFRDACGVHVPYVITPRRSGDVASLVADASRAGREWGWRASRGLAEMCRDAWRFRLLHPKGYKG